jgi:hypothetical protein
MPVLFQYVFLAWQLSTGEILHYIYVPFLKKDVRLHELCMYAFQILSHMTDFHGIWYWTIYQRRTSEIITF